MPRVRVPVAKLASPLLLAQPITFPTAHIKAKNRILKSAMSERLATFAPDSPHEMGVPTERLINLYEKFGHGGFGVLITGNIVVHPNHLELPGNVILGREIDTDQRRETLARLAKAAKADGSLIIGQLSHPGDQTSPLFNPSPFAVSEGSKNDNAIPLTTEQVKTEVVDRFVYAAKVLYDAGFNGVQLSASYIYLLAQFLSPNANKRNDQYGGPIENRLRVLLEIHDGIRAQIPPEAGFIVGVKLNSVEWQHVNDLSDSEATLVAQTLDNAGYDFMELTGGAYEKLVTTDVRESTKKREEHALKFYAAVKSKVKRAVVYLAGGFRTVPGMVAAIKNGDADGVGLAKPAATEPDIAKKILDHRTQSALFNPFEYDFITAINAGATQLAQAGNSSLGEANGNPCQDIMDLSNQEAANHYKDALVAYLTAAAETTAQGRLSYGAFEYTSLPAGVPVQPSQL
jgi:2,4-dienoyl-CoA reductase-like NADH-dependent reductase (Old Yellow Enzyme family)